MGARTRRGTKTSPMPEAWRQKIRMTEIMNRMQSGALGEVMLTSEQISAAKLVLSKVLPDISRQELTGKDGDAIETRDVTLADKAVIERYTKQLTGQK